MFPPLSVITFGQEIAMPCFVPPKCEAICLVHENGRVKGPGRRHREVVVGQVRAPDVVEVLELRFDRDLRHR